MDFIDKFDFAFQEDLFLWKFSLKPLPLALHDSTHWAHFRVGSPSQCTNQTDGWEPELPRAEFPRKWQLNPWSGIIQFLLCRTKIKQVNTVKSVFNWIQLHLYSAFYSSTVSWHFTAWRLNRTRLYYEWISESLQINWGMSNDQKHSKHQVRDSF